MTQHRRKDSKDAADQFSLEVYLMSDFGAQP